MDLYTIKNQLAAGKTIYDLPLRVTYYARVSTDKDEQTHSLKAQIAYYEEFIRGVPGWTFVRGYIDEGLSGTSVKKREAFLQMVQDARLGKFDFILTKEISRFSRSTLDSIGYTQELLRQGVGVFFQADNINTLMPDAELRLTIMSSIAQDEVRKISERVKFGFQRSIEKGVVLGNSKIWGYQKQNGRLVVVEPEAQMVREIFDLYANGGLGVRLLCRELTRRGYLNSNGNPFSCTTVRNILTNPKYKGWYCGGKTTKIDYRLSDRRQLSESEWVQYRDKEAVPPIVSEELWEKANRILAARSKQISSKATSYNNKYTYSGKIHCAQHGTPYYRTLYRYKSGHREVWQCKHFTQRGKAGCSSPMVYTAELDTILKECCGALLQEKSEILQTLVHIYTQAAGTDQMQADIAKARQMIHGVAAKKDKLLELAVGGHLSNGEFEERNTALNAQLDELRAQQEELLAREAGQRELAHSAEALGQMIARELEFPQGFSHQMVDTLLDRIEVRQGEEKNCIRLKLSFKVLPDTVEYHIARHRGKPSVCCKQHT